MDVFLRVYLPVFFIIFLLLVFIIPSVRVYRKTGINPFRFATGHSPTHDFVGNSIKVFVALLFIVIGIYSISPATYRFLVPIYYLEFDWVKIVGIILVHASLIGIKGAQREMRLSWRIGIDYENKTDLVTTGLFSRSRNPIYLFLLFGLVGMCLILPNAISLSVLFAAWVVLQISMRMEEEFLTRQHGERYLSYKKNVRRLL